MRLYKESVFIHWDLEELGKRLIPIRHNSGGQGQEIGLKQNRPIKYVIDHFYFQSILTGFYLRLLVQRKPNEQNTGPFYIGIPVLRMSGYPCRVYRCSCQGSIL